MIWTATTKSVWKSTRRLFCFALLLLWPTVPSLSGAYQSPLRPKTTDRRTWIDRCAFNAAVLTISAPLHSVFAPPILARAETTKSVQASIREATTTLQALLDNWERAVVDCTYADVPRELLDAKNKELLLEKASTFALFDKSVSVVSCKTTNRIVRDYLGVTGKGPLVGLDKALREGLDVLVENSNGDDFDAYVQLIEKVRLDLTRADSLSYSARRDFSAINNFDPGDSDKVLSSPENNDLSRAKGEIQSALDGLKQILALLPPSDL